MNNVRSFLMPSVVRPRDKEILGMLGGGVVDEKRYMADSRIYHEPRDRHSFSRSRRLGDHEDRKSTRLNSSHSQISYAVFCLKKKKSKSSTPNDYAESVN